MTNRPLVERHLWEIVPARDLLWLAAAVLLFWAAYSLRSILTPILMGFGFAYLFNPLVTRAANRWHMPRLLTISLIVLVLLLGLVAALVWMGPTFYHQVVTLAEKLPVYLSTLTSRYHVDLGDVSRHAADLAANLKEDPLSVLGPVFSGTGRAVGLIGTVIGSTLNLTLMLVLVPIFFILFAWDFDRITSSVMKVVPLAHRLRTEHVLGRMDLAVSGFFRGRLLIGLITAALYSVGWALADVPYWFLLGTVTGALTVIPYVSAIGWPLAVLLKYLDVLSSPDQGVGWMVIVVWPSATYLGVQFLESWILTPWIQSQSLSLNATTVLIVVLVGGVVGGFFGLLLAIPIAACVKILFEEFILPDRLRPMTGPRP